MLPAHTDLETLGLPAPLGGADPHQSPHPVHVDRLERVGPQQPHLQVVRQELADVVAAVAVGHLRQIVRAEREELRLGGDLIGHETGSGYLDHRPHAITDLLPGLPGDFAGHAVDPLGQRAKLLHRTDQRDHHFRMHVDAFLHAAGGGLEDGSHLHLVDRGKGDAQTAPAVTQHRVGFV